MHYMKEFDPSVEIGCVLVVKEKDCKFELQSRYYVHFGTNTLGKGMNFLILQVMGYIVPLPLF